MFTLTILYATLLTILATQFPTGMQFLTDEWRYLTDKNGNMNYLKMQIKCDSLKSGETLDECLNRLAEDYIEMWCEAKIRSEFWSTVGITVGTVGCAIVIVWIVARRFLKGHTVVE